MLIDQEKTALCRKLVESGKMREEDVSSVIAEAAREGLTVAAFLSRSKRVAKGDVYSALAEVFSVPFVDISNFRISPEAIQAVPGDLAHRHRLIPLFKIGNTLNVAMENPSDVSGVDLLAKKTRCSIDICLAAPDDVDAALREHYGSGNAIHELLESLEKEKKHITARSSREGKGKVRLRFEDKPVIQMVDLILRQACEEGASDIHIEPEEDMLRIRFRVDGVLHETATPPKDMQSEILSRVKVLAEMDIAETRVPQDGRIKIRIQEKDVEMRVSCMPTVYGENIVLRILKDAQDVLNLEHLGMSSEMMERFQAMCRRPYGMILETGPTGSGKTTTLYAGLRLINTVERNIVTVEDPVEYKLPMIRQIPVNTKSGLTFANALRSILRQDPDVIMIGEIRDRETAEIAIQSALTGHLVLSTLHANTAAGVVTRLMDMDVEAFLVASSVIGVISQRLIRRICERCREPAELTGMERKLLHLKEGENLVSFKGRGCRHCGQTGYRGRVGIFEMMDINEAVQTAIVAHASSAEIEKIARQTGNQSMSEDAFAKIRSGATSVEEVIKAIDVGHL